MFGDSRNPRLRPGRLGGTRHKFMTKEHSQNMCTEVMDTTMRTTNVYCEVGKTHQFLLKIKSKCYHNVVGCGCIDFVVNVTNNERLERACSFVVDRFHVSSCWFMLLVALVQLRSSGCLTLSDRQHSYFDRFVNYSAKVTRPCFLWPSDIRVWTRICINVWDVRLLGLL